MDIPTIPGAVYTVSTASSCDVTDKASGQLLGTAEAGSPFTTPAYSDALTLSDPSALYVQIKTFNFALAALGLLGGGNSELPSGYLRAEFLESTGTQFIDTGLSGISSDSFVEFRGYVKAAAKRAFHASGWLFASGSKTAGPYLNVPKENTVNFISGRYNVILPSQGRLDVRLRPGSMSINGNDSALSNFNVQSENGIISFNYTLKLGAYSDGASYKSERWVGTCEIFRAKLGNQAVIFVPAITPTGQPCMFDTISGEPFYNAGEGQFIVGFTLPQARKLGQLPAGATLTISLPDGYDSDAGVVAALESAEANGCVLTVQTYEAAASAVSSFALRRVWVRKRADENGTYIAGGGTRWQVDWCVTIVGVDPEQEGYELFRSVAAAVAYWELEPYADPVLDEDLLTEHNENE